MAVVREHAPVQQGGEVVGIVGLKAYFYLVHHRPRSGPRDPKSTTMGVGQGSYNGSPHITSSIG